MVALELPASVETPLLVLGEALATMRVELEELRVLEAGLDALGVHHRGGNRRSAVKS